MRQAWLLQEEFVASYLIIIIRVCMLGIQLGMWVSAAKATGVVVVEEVDNVSNDFGVGKNSKHSLVSLVVAVICAGKQEERAGREVYPTLSLNMDFENNIWSGAASICCRVRC